MTQKQIIKRYLEDLNDWQFEYKLRCLNTPYGFIGARGDRTVRDMIKSGEVEAKFEGKYRIVKYKPEIKKQTIITTQSFLTQLFQQKSDK